MVTPYDQVIISAAQMHALNPMLVRAVVLVESAGDPWAWNPEPRYRWFWDVRRNEAFRPVTTVEAGHKRPPKDFPSIAGDPDQEWWGQQASWGLMQVMGAVARERRLRAPYLTTLCDPATNLSIGCAHLASQMKWANGDIAKGLGAYNAGRGNSLLPVARAYADKVLAALETIQGSLA